ncbi:MAG: hypothetical protein AAF989_02635, partial [Planctomycetota bacterium]
MPIVRVLYCVVAASCLMWEMRLAQSQQVTAAGDSFVEQTRLGKSESVPVLLGPYLYEKKPEGAAYEKFNPRKAPATGPMLLRENDR